MEKLAEISVVGFFFPFWDQNGVKKQKEGFWRTLNGSWKRSVGTAELREGLESSSLDLGRFLPQPSLISPSHHLLSGCGSPSHVPLWGYCTSSSSLGPFCSQSSCLPSAVSRPALFKLWYPTGFVEEPEEEPWEAGCLLLLLIATSHHPHYSLAEASVPPSIGQWFPFPLSEKHRQPLPLEVLFCCLCAPLSWTTSVPEAAPA